MKKTLWSLLGALLLWPGVLCAQKKKTQQINTPVVATIHEPEYIFSQIVGVCVKNGTDTKNKTSLIKSVSEINDWGGRMIKTDLPDAENLNKLIDLPLTHYFFVMNVGSKDEAKSDEEKKNEFYTQVYSLTKDLLTRRGTPGKSIFLGVEVLSSCNPKQQTDLANTLAKAIDDARQEVPYTRCRVYSYASIISNSPSMDKSKETDDGNLSTKLKTDLVSYSFSLLQEKTAQEIRAYIKNKTTQLAYKPADLTSRVFIDHVDINFAQQKSPTIIRTLIESGASFIFLDKQSLKNPASPKTDYSLQLRDYYNKQTQAAQEMKGRTRRAPTDEEMVMFSKGLW